MVYARILLYLSFAVTITFIFSGYGYQWDIWSLGLAFTLLRYSAYGAIGIAVISLISIWFLRKSRARAIAYVVIAFLFTGIISGTALYWQHRAQSVPPIHDITTDFDNPPEFSAMVRLRADAPNPHEYNAEQASSQRDAYPNIEPVIINHDLQEVMDAAVMIVTQRGWELVAINRNEGRIEATEKLAWFGFKDDVVLRFTELEDGETRVDMRSKSRVGRSDVGVNARRINNFLRDLDMVFN
ncbi:MAG: DUF1499 domain-containing protein [Balneolaceae bacterium]|nr:DUF1499 domain-containing protein [Balneolaceae bacterium]